MKDREKIWHVWIPLILNQHQLAWAVSCHAVIPWFYIQRIDLTKMISAHQFVETTQFFQSVFWSWGQKLLFLLIVYSVSI